MEDFNEIVSSLLAKRTLPGVRIIHDPCNHLCSFLPENLGTGFPVSVRRLHLDDGEDFADMVPFEITVGVGSHLVTTKRHSTERSGAGSS